MTTTYDPQHPDYLDEADVREELTRVADICQGCRRCVDLCSTFPTLFDLIEQHEDRDAGRLTPAQQDQVVDQCFQCQSCSVNCPYVPDRHEWSLDFPRAMLRADAMRIEHGHRTPRARRASRVLGRIDAIGRPATRVSAVVNRVVAAEPGSLVRKVNAWITGLTAVRRLPPFASQRFSTWFATRPKIRLGAKQGSVTVFPTCLVEYVETGIGKDLVRVYERNGIECATTSAGCCGAPSLHAGDLRRFRKIAETNVAALADEIRAGSDVVVPQPTCGHVIRTEYVRHVGAASRADAELVAEHTHDAADYLMRIHTAGATVLDTDFTGEIPDRIVYHASGHVRARRTGYRSRDLLKLTGARVIWVQQSAGIESLWGLRDEHDDVATPVAVRLSERIEQAGGDVVTGDCHLSNMAIAEQTGRPVVHPLRVIARAYGLPDD
jgi:glycerol-3-phosphate dehydrogenase subunit C